MLLKLQPVMKQAAAGESFRMAIFSGSVRYHQRWRVCGAQSPSLSGDPRPPTGTAVHLALELQLPSPDLPAQEPASPRLRPPPSASDGRTGER